jgi:DNA polymerase III delta subunit
MLYVYYGEDKSSARKKVQATVGKMLAKNPDALYFRITTDVLGAYDFDELTGSQALFKSEYVVVLDTLFESKEGEEVVLANLKKIAKAPHPFFILDAQLLASTSRKLEKHAEQVHEFTHKTTEKKESFNTFLLTDALGERDAKKLWMLFREAKHNGTSDEEIHGILFWMLKSLVLAHKTSTSDEAGMKPYPYRKAKRYSKNFESRERLTQLLAEFALLPQYARRRGTPLEIELERFIVALA